MFEWRQMETYLAVGLLVVATVVLGTWIATTYIRRWNNFRRYDFDWYGAEFPKLVTKDQVICYKCNSADIGVERQFQQTYMRSHVCRRCGTTLYYSKER